MKLGPVRVLNVGAGGVARRLRWDHPPTGAQYRFGESEIGDFARALEDVGTGRRGNGESGCG